MKSKIYSELLLFFLQDKYICAYYWLTNEWSKNVHIKCLHIFLEHSVFSILIRPKNDINLHYPQ